MTDITKEIKSTTDAMAALDRMSGKIIMMYNHPEIPKRIFDIAHKDFIKLCDFIIEELSPHTIMRMTFKALPAGHKHE